MQVAATLERHLVRELARAYRDANVSHFKSALRFPVLALEETSAFLGRWSPSGRRLTLSRAFLLEHPWGAVVEVLKHEMAHQYVDEVLGARDEAPHGKAFRDVCTRMGVDASASGLPSPRVENALVDKVARLLALSGSSNQHEAEAAAVAARRLMARYNLDAVTAGEHGESYTFAHLGRVTGRVEEHERLLASILGKHYFVEVIWVPSYRVSDGKRASTLEICGTRENVSIAEYVFHFLLRTANELFAEHKRRANVRSNRERRTFLAGVMTGFLDKLKKDEASARREGLVWAGSPELRGYFRRRHPYVRNVRHGGRARSDAFDEGRSAGREIVVRRGVEGASAKRPLLPSG